MSERRGGAPSNVVRLPARTGDSAIETKDEGWGAMKLRPSRTGLRMAVWINENDGWPHDVRVKVSKLYGGAETWTRDSAEVGVRPSPHEIVPGSLAAGDWREVRRWIELNRNVIVDFWDGKLDPGDALARLKPLPSSAR